jgi:hypothetical protein
MENVVWFAISRKGLRGSFNLQKLPIKDLSRWERRGVLCYIHTSLGYVIKRTVYFRDVSNVML